MLKSIDLTTQQQAILKQLEKLEPALNNRNPQLSLKPSFKQQQIPKSTVSSSKFFSIKYDSYYQSLKDKLKKYKQESEKVYKLSEYLKQDSKAFEEIKIKKDQLIQQIETIKGSTSQYVENQKKMINLSIAMKQALHYYEFIDKFQFDWVCDLSQRQMFQQSLLPTISQLTDGIFFFKSKSTYSSSTKYLNNYTAARWKVSTFIKNFFVKLLSKQQNFVMKKLKMNGFGQNLNILFPKARPDFLNHYLICYPQLKKTLKTSILYCKDSEKEKQLNQLTNLEVQIDEFLISESNINLIQYLQSNLPEIYQEVLVKFLLYYRNQIHDIISKNYRFATDSDRIPFHQAFNNNLNLCAYLTFSQLCYLTVCMQPSSQVVNQQIKQTVKEISQLYTKTLMRDLKNVRKNKQPFKVCQIIINFIEKDLKLFLDRSIDVNYQSYPFSQLYNNSLKIYEERLFQNKMPKKDIHKHISLFFYSIFESLSSKLMAQLQIVCIHTLPKIVQTSQLPSIIKDVQDLLGVIDNLSYFPTMAQKYLIGVLDIIVKSVKECNNKIQSRFQCYCFNLEVFGAINQALNKVKFNVQTKQLRLDINHTATMIDRVKTIRRPQNFEGLWKYAQDVFVAIKTGIPTLNELTLDFTKFIEQHYIELQERFMNDIFFIFGKNLIQFLEKLTRVEKKIEEKTNDKKQHSNQQQTRQNSVQIEEEKKQKVTIENLVQEKLVEALYTRYLLSLQSFIKQAKRIRKTMPRLNTSYTEGIEVANKIIDQVYEEMFQLLSQFYIKISKYSDCTRNFEDIKSIKDRLSLYWQKQDSGIQ